jgi:hypothetical protein
VVGFASILAHRWGSAYPELTLISQVHQVSDWVFTVDRNFGLEYLDSPYDEHCPVYLIDYQPEFLNETGHRLIISTQGVGETERLLQPVLERLSLPMDPVASRSLVNALRSVSGRLVLKLLSSPQMAHGAIGMALSLCWLLRVSVPILRVDQGCPGLCWLLWSSVREIGLLRTSIQPKSSQMTERIMIQGTTLFCP